MGEPSTPAALFAVLTLINAGCARPPPSAPCGGEAGPTAPWCVEADFPGTLPPATPEAVRAVAAALASACPPPTAEDPTPGLSRAARSATGLHRNRVPALLRIDTAFLERFVAGMPAGDPRRVVALDRLADGYMLLELDDYERCREATIPAAPGAYELAQIRDRVLDTVRSLRRAREGGARACALLRRDYPEHAPAVPCPP
jgi:hypothetical protein